MIKVRRIGQMPFTSKGSRLRLWVFSGRLSNIWLNVLFIIEFKQKQLKVFSRVCCHVVLLFAVFQDRLTEDIFFFLFAYTTSPAAVMKLVFFFRSSKPPYNFWWSGVADGHCAIRFGWYLLHLWRTCSVVWSSSPQGHIVGRNEF